LAAKLHEEPQALPCSDWSANDKDATPTVESAVSPDYREPEKNPDASGECEPIILDSGAL
jgi:hypothetical protein